MRVPGNRVAIVAGGGNAAPRHRDIEEHHVWALGLDKRDRLFGGAGFADHGEVGILGDAAHETFAEDRVIVGQNHADAHGVSPSASGRCRRKVVPRPRGTFDLDVAADALGAVAQASEALAAVRADAGRGGRGRSLGHRP